jgi:uncharacterized protein (TIGR03435 family)
VAASACVQGQVVVTNYTLRDIIRNAYNVQRYQIAGGPEWLAQDRFDITAKAPDGATQPQLLVMVQTLLADRFKLRVHRETREVPIYALVLARADRRLGPKLQPATFDCAGRCGSAGARREPGDAGACG